MPTSPVSNGSASPRGRLTFLVVLCLPTIIGTAFFLVGVLLSRFDILNDAPVAGDAFRNPTLTERVKIGIAVVVFFTCYFGAAFGPIFLPFAAWDAFALTRDVGLRSR